MSGIGGGPLLWALGAEEIVPAIIAILILLVSGLSQWLGKMKQPQQPPGNPPQRPVVVAEPRQAAPEERAMEDEIGEFLRRTAKRRGPQAPQPAPAALEPVLVEPERAGPVGGQLETHVTDYLNAGEFSQRTAQLGGEVAQAGQQFGQHLQQVFDHELSSLAGAPGDVSAQSAAAAGAALDVPVANLPITAAAGFAALLSDMESVRQAIVINEILRRPEERWG